MSKGPSLLNENPLWGLSNCIDETPISNIKPSTFFVLSFFKTEHISLNLLSIKLNLVPYSLLNSFALDLTLGSWSIAITSQAHESKSFLVYPPQPNVASKYNFPDCGLIVLITSFSKTGVCSKVSPFIYSDVLKMLEFLNNHHHYYPSDFQFYQIYLCSKFHL